jgi:hypothetical protein
MQKRNKYSNNRNKKLAAIFSFFILDLLIYFLYPFRTVGKYILTFEARINGDPKYQVDPLVANFNISVSNLRQVLHFGQLMLYYIIPSTATVAAVIVYFQAKQLHIKKKNKN